MKTRRRGKIFASVFALALALVSLAGTKREAVAEASAAAAAELPVLALVSPVSGFSQPLSIAHAGDGSGRLFVAEQGGRIRIVKNGAILSTPFLDISGRISTGGERGLLGLAFPPGYPEKRYFYVNYTDTAGHTVIARYRVSADPNVADPASEQVLLRVNQPYANHNGGQLAFSPRDGYLYIGMGDGGSGGDPENRAQNPQELLGKVLRLDTETGSPATYHVPTTNPFVNRTGFRPEIWSLGLRNPWRFSFDRQTADLYVADVGQGAWEEVNFQTALSAGGENYGWRIMEGNHCFNPSTGCNTAGLTLPVAEYSHSLGCSITGGYTYRGDVYPRMRGLYIYGDYCSGRIWGLRREASEWQNTLLLDTAHNISTFGEDEAGNLYLANISNGTIYTLIDATPSPAASSVQFGAARYTATEGVAAVPITVTRTGSSDGTVTVGYEVSDQTARQKSDYTLAAGRLTFAPGETSKSFDLLVNEDSYAESTPETVRLTLNTPTGGATLGAQTTATLDLNDNGDTGTGANPIDDTNIFVGQHYHDFLNRQADAGGQAFWASQIAACGADAACIDDRRQNVSAAFFLSIEFQSTGYLVYRFEKASFNRQVRYEPFLRDVRRLSEGVIVGQTGWEARLEANRQAFAREWTERAEFRLVYDGKSNAEYVNALFANTGATPTDAERQALIDGLNASTETRATVLLKLSENGAVYNKLYNPAFVLMQYFGYLRRNPDDAPDNNLVGYNFWLNKMNEFSQPGEDVRVESVALGRAKRAQMVRSFLVSGEYRERFGR